MSLENACSIGFRSGTRDAWQIEQLGPAGADCSPYGRVLMAAEIVHHHAVTWPQSWNQELHHPGEGTLGVDGAIQDARRGNPITSQPGHGM